MPLSKERITKLLDFWFEPRGEGDFVKTFTDSGFLEPRLIKTDPPNISVGTTQRKGG